MKRLDSAMAEGKRNEAQQAQAQVDQAQAEIDLYEVLIERATIVAPITGTVIAGDLEAFVGSSVRQGDSLFEIAPLDDIIVIARVDDRDISFIDQTRLNDDLAERLSGWGYPPADVQAVRDAQHIWPPEGGRTAGSAWEPYYTPELKAFIRRKERWLFEWFPRWR